MKTNHLKNMLWNAGGNLSYLAAQWLVTVLVARWFTGYDSAGVLSVAMSLSAIFQTVALFGMRNYQVSDINGKHSDSAYFCFRHITAGASLLFTGITALLLGYRGETLLAVLLFMLFRIAECYSDVLHGMAQKVGRLDVAGMGFAIKAVALFAGFLAGYYLGGTLVTCLLGMLIGSVVTTLVFDLPIAKHLAPFRIRYSPKRALPLAKETLPLCVYFFLLSAISSIPKLVLEKVATDGTAALGAYASIFAPALLIAGAAGYLYTPFIPTFAELIERGNERGVRRLLGRLLVLLTLLLLLLIGAALLLGEWALVLVFGQDIRPHAGMLIPILFAVFASAILSFFCMLAVVRRRFLLLCISVGVGAALSLGLALLYVRLYGANGASYALLVSSAVASMLLSPAVFCEQRVPCEPCEVTHTFALCAYRESPYLEACVQSLLAQTVKSEIFISTSTPCDHIRAIADKYGLPLYINTGEAGITGDWNFAVAQVKTPYFTIAHQDDVYDPTFTEAVLKGMEGKDAILVFTDYYELREGKKCENSSVQRVKRLLALPLKLFGGSRFVRRRVLSLGNAICCPAVTYVTEKMKDFAFDKRYAFVCDWDAFERLANERGCFIRIPARLMGHRIHEESATTALTASPRRAAEEAEMFCRFWPRPIARLILRFYAKGADSNDLSRDKTKK